VPDESGDWEFGLGSCGYLNLFFDGKLLIENNESFEAGELFFMMGSTEKRAIVKNLVKGQSYTIEARGMFRWQPGFLNIPFGIRLGAKRIVDPQDAIDAASTLAASSDVAIVVVGVTGEIETEGFDRKNIE
jgi:beta-glucosidase